MGDFLELGIEGVDKLIDKHFDKVPDKALHAHTYHPKNLKNIRKGSKQDDQQAGREPRRRRDSSPLPPRAREKRYYDDQDYDHQTPYPRSDAGMGVDDGRPRNDANSSPYLQDGPFVAPPLPIYSQHPPHQRPEYVPEPRPVDPYYAPPPVSDRRRTYDEDYYSPPRRPANMRRRSSSYHGPRRYNDEFYSSDEDKQVAVVSKGKKPRHHGSHGDFSDKLKDNARRYGLKEEITGQFSKSKEGMAGGAVGAVLGGWVAHKALESRDREGKGTEDAILTLLGAAVGGLAVNTVVDKWEDGKLEALTKEKKWEDKWEGKNDRRGDDRRGEGRSRRDRDDRDRRGRDRYSDDGYYR